MLFTFPLTDIDNDLQRHLCGQVWDNKYYYLNQLMALDACKFELIFISYISPYFKQLVKRTVLSSRQGLYSVHSKRHLTRL